MERPRIYSRDPEQADPTADAFNVIDAGLRAPPVGEAGADEALRRATLDVLAQATDRLAAADRRAAQLEEDGRRLEDELRSEIYRLRLELGAAEERIEAGNQFLETVNAALRDLVG